MKTFIHTLLTVFLFISLAITAGIAGSELNSEYSIVDRVFKTHTIGIEGLNTTTVEGIIDECKGNGSRIDKEIECVQTHVKRFFSYQVRDDDEVISFETLMNDGGDCGNWADFWIYVGEGLGYNSESKRIPVDSKTAHRFAVITNHEGYCVADQSNINCFMYG